MSTFNTRSKILAREAPSLADVILAIHSHKQCAGHLENFMLGRSGDRLDPDFIGQHERCSLGHWLNNTCKYAYSGLPLIDDVIATHASLHFTARHILLRYFDGAHDEAISYLYEGAFPDNSKKLKGQLIDLAYYIEQQHHGIASSMVLGEIVSEGKR